MVADEVRHEQDCNQELGTTKDGQETSFKALIGLETLQAVMQDPYLPTLRPMRAL